MPTDTAFSARLRGGLALAALACALVSGCSSGKWGFPYRAGVQQGNWITQEQVAMLQVGMTREQVRFALGSPTLTSVLHADRWDYPYFYQPGRGKPQERQFTVWFENDRLARWSGDEQPALQPFQQAKQDAARAAGEAGASQEAAPPVPDTAPPAQDAASAAPGTATPDAGAEAIRAGVNAPVGNDIVADPNAVPGQPGASPEPLR